MQVEAVLSGVQPGLSMVVGPPGTGKTDVAVQIMNVLYNTNPDQRTLLITHSNQALNDLFSKIMERDIPARYLLRLGQGEQVSPHPVGKVTLGSLSLTAGNLLVSLKAILVR